MKKLFTIDDFMVAFISAMGYGFGYMIPMYLGWPELACLVACFDRPYRSSIRVQS